MQISIIRIDDVIWARNNKQKATRFTEYHKKYSNLTHFTTLYFSIMTMDKNG